MELKACTLNEISEIYNTYLVVDFPKNEVKPLSRITELYEKQLYFAYGLYGDGNALLAYAFLYAAPNSDFLLLDYFAVLKSMRGEGLGTKALSLLCTEVETHFAGLIIEAENPDFAETAEEKEIRKRRIRFYERNGFEHTQILSRLFGVEYCILVRTARAPSTLNLTQSVINTYHTLIPSKHWEKNVSVRIEEDS